MADVWIKPNEADADDRRALREQAEAFDRALEGPTPGRCMACGQYVTPSAVICGPCDEAETRRANPNG